MALNCLWRWEWPWHSHLPVSTSLSKEQTGSLNRTCSMPMYAKPTSRQVSRMSITFYSPIKNSGPERNGQIFTYAVDTCRFSEEGVKSSTESWTNYALKSNVCPFLPHPQLPLLGYLWANTKMASFHPCFGLYLWVIETFYVAISVTHTPKKKITQSHPT